MIKISLTSRRSPGRTIDKFDVPLNCVHCSHEIRKSLAELKDDPILTCPNCLNQFKVDSGGTARIAADGLDELDRAFDSIGKR